MRLRNIDPKTELPLTPGVPVVVGFVPTTIFIVTDDGDGSEGWCLPVVPCVVTPGDSTKKTAGSQLPPMLTTYCQGKSILN